MRFSQLVLLYAHKCRRSKTWKGKKIDIENTLLKQEGLNKNDECIKSIIFYNNGILFYSTKISPFSVQKVIDAFNEAYRTLVYVIQKDNLLENKIIDLNDILVADIDDNSTESGNIVIIETNEKEINMSKKDVSTVTVKTRKKKTVTTEYGSSKTDTEKKTTSNKKNDSNSKNKETLSDQATKKLNSEKNKK